MFDKLIASEPAGADIKNRRSYFLVSSFVVGVLFLTAVVFSIYAADYGLGTDGFDLVEVVMPPDMAAVPEPEREPENDRTQTSSDQAIRTTNVSRTDEPTIVPLTTSSQVSPYVARPYGDFVIGNENSGPIGSATTGRDPNAAGTGTGLATSRPVDEVTDSEPAPVIKDPPPRKSVSGGVVNGRATNLPKPIYPAAARAVRAQGKVQVQVTIDEAGRVISANAVNGHPLLLKSAEDAAWKARFGSTTLTGVPVKVTGIIIYNFVL